MAVGEADAKFNVGIMTSQTNDAGCDKPSKRQISASFDNRAACVNPSNLDLDNQIVFIQALETKKYKPKKKRCRGLCRNSKLSKARKSPIRDLSGSPNSKK